MPDLYTLHTRPESAPAVTMETADGWLVISKMLRCGSVKPPYQYQYDADHYASLEDAEGHYTDLERGEYSGWHPVAIVPCKGGVPLGSKRIV